VKIFQIVELYKFTLVTLDHNLLQHYYFYCAGLDINSLRPHESKESGKHEITGGALWDIFRREDSDKLQDYLKEHTSEFRHIHCNPVKQVLFSLHSLGIYFSCFPLLTNSYFNDPGYSPNS
jgi:hypothetical protein